MSLGTDAPRRPSRRAAAPLVARRRHRHSVPAQFVRFALVGASGYLVNLVTFALVVHVAGEHYRLAATAAFLVAVSSNFVWNRHWTFAARDGRRSHQAARFLTVSVAAFLISLVALTALVDGAGLAKLPAQAIATIAVTPISFLGNRLWTFKARPPR